MLCHLSILLNKQAQKTSLIVNFACDMEQEGQNKELQKLKIESLDTTKFCRANSLTENKSNFLQ